MASSNVESKPEDAVTVTLLSRNTTGSYSAGFPERRFVLSRHAPSVPIGRASKVPSKGFVAAKDNAWFDSPVMSRQHAELVVSFDATPKAVFIKDIGSLHGTFHTPNDASKKRSRIEQDQSVKLSNGDILQFGIDIFRSKETFPPCSVDFLVEENNKPLNTAVCNPEQSPNRVFTVPDDDIDDDEDADVVSDSDSIMETGRPSIDLTREEADSPDIKPLPSSNTIRITASRSDFIDLTSEPDAEPDAEPAAEPDAGSYPVLARFDHTRQLDIPLPSILTEPAISAAPSGSQVNGNGPCQELITSNPRSNHFSDQEDVDPLEEHIDSEDIGLSSSDNESLMTNDSTDDMSDAENDIERQQASPSFEVRDDYGASDDSEQEDDESMPIIPAWSYPIADAGGFPLGPYPNLSYFDEHEGDYSNDSASESSRDEMYDIGSSSGSPAPDSPRSSSPAPKSNSAELPNDQQLSKTVAALFGPFIGHTSPTVQAREPSPSDAALARSRPTSMQNPNYSRAQALGDKSGKHEYFVARESNRTILNHDASLPVSAIRETLGNESEGQVTETRLDSTQLPPSSQTAADMPLVRSSNEPVDVIMTAPEASSEAHDTASVDVKASAGAPDSAWSASGERFINHPRTEDLPLISAERPRSPELDMTSAYTFQQSKMACEARAKLNLRRLPIEDLLAQEPQSDEVGDIAIERLPPIVMPAPTSVSRNLSGPVGLKRTFEDAFVSQLELVAQTDTINQAHMRADERPSSAVSAVSNKQAPDTLTLGNKSSPEPASIAPVEPSQGEQQQLTTPVQQDYSRPSKRRCLAQAAAYVAVGGAAVFTFMVSTAPSF
ncbi:hypothetical protein F5B20DRAFT_575508 [Whalleya microplaca]|nr:hypothetical protein F5B20DRAFT_575508 [Whalleya microplaca]